MGALGLALECLAKRSAPLAWFEIADRARHNARSAAGESAVAPRPRRMLY